MGLSNYVPSSRISQAGVCTSTTRPAGPYEGQIIYETDTDRTLVWNGSSWRFLGRPAVESRFAIGVGYTTVANTNWAALTTGMDISIYANEGDVVEVYMQFLQGGTGGGSAAYYRMDAGIIVGGSLVSYMGDAGGGANVGGFMGGGYPYSDGWQYGRTIKTVSSNELSSNTLTLRPYIRQFGSVVTTIYHGVDQKFYFGAINHGPDLG